ncbi:hypothetical protein [Sebaldella sp. S0638]|uniref:hypothetical protein n=1 Tax=Sebaldella sp. S0638 TaxID=2957809 RepID=UPI00209CF31D|nr:hypothetical protein [Sebaldella sp. S0638]MCP1225736.1 hypothetical protein [Sebaldella sp. S0638]
MEKLKWYQKKWVIILFLLFIFPIGLILLWINKGFTQKTKIILSVAFGIFFIIAMVNGAAQEKDSNKLYTQAIEEIKQGKLSEAKQSLEKSIEKNSNEESKKLKGEIDKLEQTEFINNIIGTLTDNEYKQAKEGKLNKQFLANESLNTLLLQKIKNDNNSDKIREEQKVRLKAEAEAKAKEERMKLIEKQFSSWDGSHKNLTEYIKSNMNDAKSYEHVETRYKDNGETIYVVTKFRGNNAFGAKVIGACEATANTETGELTNINCEN